MRSDPTSSPYRETRTAGKDQALYIPGLEPVAFPLHTEKEPARGNETGSEVENLWSSPAPVLKNHRAPVVRERCDGATGLTIEGHAAVNAAGRAVVIRTRAGAWIVPLVLFRRAVARLKRDGSADTLLAGAGSRG